MHTPHSDFRTTCLLPLLLPIAVFGVLCLGASVVDYFHAKEVFILLFLFFFALVIGFLAALILFGILHACWLNSYVEREVKQEFRDRFCYTIFGCGIVLCTLITFFGCFGEVVGKTWDNMDISVRNDEWASAETEKEEKLHTEESPFDAFSDGYVHDTMEQEETPRPTPAAFSAGPGQKRLVQDQVFRVSHATPPSHPLDDDFFLPPVRRRDLLTKLYRSRPAPKRITDSDDECAVGCEQEDFWITEEDDETHNSSCSRYGEGEGMYSAQGSGTDCPECGGAR